jgi:hypothetical protein
MSRGLGRLLSDLSVSRADEIAIDDIARARSRRLASANPEWLLATAGLVEIKVKPDEATLLISMGAADQRELARRKP